MLADFLTDAAGAASGVRVAAGDVNGDGKADIIAGNGPGGLPRVTVFDATNRAELYNFFAFDTTFRGGLYVAASDLTGDGSADVVVSCGPGGSPRVRVFSGASSASVSSFLAYKTGFTGGRGTQLLWVFST